MITSTRKITSIIPLLLIVLNCSAQEVHIKHQGKTSLTCCYNKVLLNIQKQKVQVASKFVKAPSIPGYKISVKQNKLEILGKDNKRIVLRSDSDSIDMWNKIMDWSKVTYSIVKTPGYTILIVSGPRLGLSGLETNFKKFLIINLSTGYFDGNSSLSDDNRFFYVDRGVFNCALFEYSQKFVDERDYDHPSLNILKYSFDGKVLKLSSSTFADCSCK